MPQAQSTAASSSPAFVGQYAAILSVVEVGLGALLHGLKVPLAGQFLSCNQGFLLCRAMKKASDAERSRFLGSSISNVAALLKSLSPAGKKLTPMLAISSQGFLFSLGTLLLGANFFGSLLGITLLSFWAFLQPLLLAYLLFGKTLIEGAKKLFESLGNSLPFINWDNFLLFLTGLVFLKVLFCALLCVLAYTGGEKVDAYFFKMQKLGHERKRKAKKARAFFLQPLFLISFAITLFFFFYSDSPQSEFLWIVIRPLALGTLMYFLALYLPLEKWAARLQSTRFSRFGNTLENATSFLKNPSDRDT